MSNIPESLKHSLYKIKVLRMRHKNSTFKYYHSNNLCKIINFGICEKTHQELVVCQNIKNDQVWIINVDVFFKNIEDVKD